MISARRLNQLLASIPGALIAAYISAVIWHFVGYRALFPWLADALASSKSPTIAHYPRLAIYSYYAFYFLSPFLLSIVAMSQALRSWPFRALAVFIAAGVSLYIFAVMLPGNFDVLLEDFEVLPRMWRRHLPYEDWAATEHILLLVSPLPTYLCLLAQRQVRRLAGA